MSLATTLFPPANREAAMVAFLRTFWQTVRATGLLGGAGVITVSATKLASVDVSTLLYALGAVLLSGILTGLISAGDILVHGIPDAYAASIPAAIVTPALDMGTAPSDPVATPAPAVVPVYTADPVPVVPDVQPVAIPAPELVPGTITE